jgi:sialic acid synthase SpsE
MISPTKLFMGLLSTNHMSFLVGEIGVNWDGNLILLKEIMKKSKEIGINAVKFQAFNDKNIKGHPESKRLLKSAISESNVKEVNQIASDLNLEWFCTPMYPEAVDFLEPFVKKFKIRHSDGVKIVNGEYSELFEKILKTDKEIIISSQKNPNGSKFFQNPKIKWLYCVPKYPCELEELNFKDLKNFNGFSNHCPKIIAPLTASILGAKIIEIHLTPNKSMNFIDNNVSFDYNEIKELIRMIKLSEKIKND